MEEPAVPPTPAENKFDPEKLRKEILRIKNMDLDQLRQLCLENEYAVYAIQQKYDATVFDILDKIQTSPDVRKEYGRAMVPTVLTTTSKWLMHKAQMKLLWAELDFKKQEAASKRNTESMDDLAQGIIMDLEMKKLEGDSGGDSSTTQGETP